MSHDAPHDKDRPDDPAAAGGDTEAAGGSGVSGSGADAAANRDTTADPDEPADGTKGDGKKAAAEEDPGRGENTELWTNPRGNAGRVMRRWERRRQKIRDEIERNRRGEYKVPTWVLVVALIAVIVGWLALIFWV